jgi:hypothetical protein
MSYLSLFLLLALVVMTAAAIIFGREADILAAVNLCQRAQITDLIEHGRELTAASVASTARINELLDLVRAQKECISAQEQEIALRST